MEKAQFEIENSVSDFLSVNKVKLSDSVIKHLYNICEYFNDLTRRLLFFKTINNDRTIVSISKAINLSRVAIYKSEVIMKYINYRNDDLDNMISKINISDKLVELEKEIAKLNRRDVTIENLTFDNENLRQENTTLKREIDRLKKLISLNKS